MSEDQEPPPIVTPPQDFSKPPQYQQAYRQQPSPASQIVPITNPRALLSYYLAVFGLIPGFCLFLGPAALVLGILGLKAYNQRPEIGGRIHAWVGIILGGLITIVCLVSIVVIAVNVKTS